jgi:hypothetical protein
MKDVGARDGDEVRVYWDPSNCMIRGVVHHVPMATGDSWVIVADDGTIYHVQAFDFMEVLSRKHEQEASNERQP